MTMIRILLILAVLLSKWSDGQGLLSNSYKLPPGITLKEGQRFDYIVVGAGAAGAAAAARLSLAGHCVLLVEAGGDPSFMSKIPSAAVTLFGSEIDWQYNTIPNNMSCLSSQGQQCRFSRGKCLGGSTSINYMMYTRGNPRDFEDIPVPGWTWTDIFPYFLKYEGLQDLDLLPPSSKPYHNTTGTMRIGFFDDPQNPWHSRLIKGFKAMGFPENLDVNAQSQIGVSKIVGYVYDGERMSTARGYLGRKDVQKNLKVAKNTLCTGVIIDKKNVARGVTVIQDSLKLNIYARREVILSAGAIGSPQILLLSGIGPADHLRSIGIRVKMDLEGVGANMTDHVLPLIIALVDQSKNFEQDVQNLVNKSGHVSQLLVSNSGPLTSNGLTDITVFANTKCYDFETKKLLNKSLDGSDCAVPNFQLGNAYVDRGLFTVSKSVDKPISFDENVMDQLSQANENHALMLFSPINLWPYSYGYVRLSSADPLAPLAIFPNYLSDERDLDDMLRNTRIIENLMETPIFRSNNASILYLSLPGCPSFKADNEGYWRCYARHMTTAVFHATGTCALGSVLDGKLRVLGVRRLRVADLSVLPRVPRANTAAVAIAIGERVADFVLEDLY